MKLRKGDNVRVISGKDRGKEGEIKKVLPSENKVIVEGVNIASRHTARRNEKQQSEIRKIEMPISARPSCAATMNNAPTIGPIKVPMPPTNAINTPSPDMSQCASGSAAIWNTSAFSAPPIEARKADSTNAMNL